MYSVISIHDAESYSIEEVTGKLDSGETYHVAEIVINTTDGGAIVVKMFSDVRVEKIGR